MSRHKTLAERLVWMAENLLGFATELKQVRQVEISALYPKGPALINAARSSLSLPDSTSVQPDS